MNKVLYYRRHSKRMVSSDGKVSPYIGLEGIDLARREGYIWDHSETLNYPEKIFHGPLVRTAQTALAFTLPLKIQNLQIMPIVEEIGTEEMMKQIGTPEFQAEFKANGGNALGAVFKV